MFVGFVNVRLGGCCISLSAPAQIFRPGQLVAARGRARSHPAGAADDKRAGPGTMTHDYKRNGTTTLFAALNLLDGSVIGQCMQRHRHQEFIRFLNRYRGETSPAGKLVHVVLRQLRHPQAPEGTGLARPAARYGLRYRSLPCRGAAAGD